MQPGGWINCAAPTAHYPADAVAVGSKRTGLDDQRVAAHLANPGGAAVERRVDELDLPWVEWQCDRGVQRRPLATIRHYERVAQQIIGPDSADRRRHQHDRDVCGELLFVLRNPQPPNPAFVDRRTDWIEANSMGVPEISVRSSRKIHRQKAGIVRNRKNRHLSVACDSPDHIGSGRICRAGEPQIAVGPGDDTAPTGIWDVVARWLAGRRDA